MVFFNFFQLEWNTRKKIHSVNNIVWTTVVKQCLFAVSPTSAKYGMYFMMGPNDYTRSEKVNTSSPNLRIATPGNVQGLMTYVERGAQNSGAHDAMTVCRLPVASSSMLDSFHPK